VTLTSGLAGPFGYRTWVNLSPTSTIVNSSLDGRSAGGLPTSFVEGECSRYATADKTLACRRP